jgi:hypothetical protein
MVAPGIRIFFSKSSNPSATVGVLGGIDTIGDDLISFVIADVGGVFASVIDGKAVVRSNFVPNLLGAIY